MAHEHNHAIANYNRSFAIGVSLNIIFVIIEVIYGVSSNSLALLADAGHNFSDVISLLLAWGASILATRATTQTRTYGYRKATIMASLISAVLLFIALGGIIFEAIGRFRDSHYVDGTTVIFVAAIGVIINTLTALLFLKGQENDLNIRGAFLHMAADAIVSLGVVIAGVIIIYKNWLWIDPLISLVIGIVIFIGTWGLFRDSLNYSIDSVPRNMDISKIDQYLNNFKNVTSIHDLHVWSLSTTEVALTVHIVVDEDLLNNLFLENIQEHLHHDFHIEHATIQIETSSTANNCVLNRERCI